MPLIPGSPVGDTIRELHTGKTYAHTAAKFGKERAQKQAVAIALSNERKGRAIGGVANYDSGGGVDPVAQVIAALSAGSNSSGGLGNVAQTIGSSNPAAPSSAQATSAITTNSGGVAPQVPMNPQTTANPATTLTAPTVPSPGIVPSQTQAQTPQPVTPIANKLMARGGLAAGGVGFNKPPKPVPTAPTPSWTVRQAENRSLHTGPILSTVPGRTDNHITKVASGSYVLPAAHVASMGQGNSVAGLQVAHNMFGPTGSYMAGASAGPYGAGKMGIKHGSGAPRPPHPFAPSQPKMPKMFAYGGGPYSEGGGRGHGEPEVPVDVALSGGEYVIHPSVVRIIGHGSIKQGHEILDRYVMKSRKKEIETQRKLPPPAKK